MSGSSVRPSTLVELLHQRAAEGGDTGYVFLADGERQEVRLSFAGLRARAGAVAAELDRRGLEGSRALLVYPPGLDYVCGFFGCLLGQVVAVPTYPPDPARLERSVRRLLAIVDDARPAVALTTAAVRSALDPLLAAAPALARLQWVATDQLAPAPGDMSSRSVGPDRTAFLQYTSGSTGAPRGVELTHRNLIHNSARIHAAFGHGRETRGVIWLPPYHDMGLIGGIVQPLYGGFEVVLMSPLAFLERPMRWLEAISRYRGTASGGPDFAYDLCARKSSPEQRASLDLSSWQLAFDGAEPVRAATLARFADAFAPAGFRPEAFFPCYGLAESTLIATGGPRLVRPRVMRVRRDELARGRAVEAPDAGVELVGSGEPFEDGALVIVDPARAERCADGEIGEIWLAGESVARGYFGRPEETERAFGARLTDAAGPFLRTGDLGFVHRGELFVAGRLKDLIIVRGRNHHPTDLERTAERSHRSIRPGCSAAFQLGVDDARVVLVAELSRAAASGTGDGSVDGLAEVSAEIRQAVAEEHELALHAVVLVRAGSVPKTSSGKVERYACREAYLGGGLAEVARSELGAGGADAGEGEGEAGDAPDEGALRRQLASRIARLIGVPVSEVEADRPLTAIGLDSLMAVELQAALESELGAQVAAVDLLKGASLEQIARRVEEAAGVDGGRGREAVTAATAARAATAATAAPDEVPLSIGQRALWFLQLLSPDSAAYNLWLAARVRGAAGPAELAAACQRLVDRHPALRAAVFVRDGVPWQRTAPGPIDFEVIDADGMSEERLREEMIAEAHRPFDLGAGVFRVRFYRRGDGGALLAVCHHMAIDLWSAGLLLAELARGGDHGDGGDGGDDGDRAAIAAPSLADHVAGQAAWLASERGAAAWAHWSRALAGPLPALDLALDHPRPRRQSFRGGARALEIDAGAAARLRQLARGEDATVYAVLLAAFAVLLHRLSDQDDLLIGSPTVDRSPGFERVVGYFVNPVVIRADASGDPTFREMVRRVRAAALDAIEHRAMPFPVLVERLAASRPLDRAPLFQALFALERAHTGPALGAFLAGGDASVELAGIDAALEPIALEERASAFDVALVLVEDGGSLRGSLRYDAALFDGATAGRWARQLQTLIASLIEDPDQRVGSAPLAGDEERQRSLVEWNPCEAAPTGEPLFHALVDEQVRRDPDARAVVMAGEAISYRELDRRADRLARRLARLGVGPERVVAVLLERSIEWVVAVLGVLRAGGVYLPVEPTLPDPRVRFLVEDAGAVAAVTSRRLAPRVGALPWVCVDQDDDDDQDDDPGDRMPVAAPQLLADHAAYIIYTSGSTGRPKGVAVSHRSACNLAAAQRRSFGVTPEHQVLQYASCAFDASFFELSLALTAGAALHLVPAAAVLPGPALVRLLQDGAITTVTFPPAVLAALSADQLPDIHTVISAGEACPPAAVSAWGSGRRFFNAYGPTEATVWSTVARLGPPDGATGDGRQPIGGPVAGVRAYVLDRHHRPAPVGAIGELHVGGVSVARGYVGRPGLTAARFLPDPFGPPGGRLYRTGDLARWLDDGAIDLLGRADDQVKIRGVRIEPGEIEAALRDRAGVREVAVIARADRTGEPQLVAYLAADDPAELAIDRLRAFLRERGLPDTMLPAAVVHMPSLPRTPSGKLDRRALPGPAEPARSGSAAPPSGELEQLLLGVFREVLGHEQIGADDHFFEVLGGSSMAVVRACALLGERAAIDVPVTAIFEHPTIRALAVHLSGRAAPVAATTDAAPSHQDRARARAETLRRRRR